MEPTKQEGIILTEAKRNILTIFALCVAIAAFMCTKFEYRPIAVSYRTITAGTAYQPSVSRYTDVSVSVQIACTISLTTGQTGSYSLQTSPDNITYTTIQQLTNSNSGSLTIGLNLTNTNGAVLKATVPPNYYYKLVTTSTTGSPTFTILTQSQETQL